MSHKNRQVPPTRVDDDNGAAHAHAHADDHSDAPPNAGDIAQSQLYTMHGLLKYVIDPVQYPLPPRPPDNLLFPQGKPGTTNYHCEGTALPWSWCLVALGSGHADTIFWRGELLKYLKDEHREFMGGEQLAPNPHDAMYHSGHGVPHLISSKAPVKLPDGRWIEYGDAEIAGEERWWFSSLFGILDQCSVGGEVYAPCCNSRTDVPLHRACSTLWRARQGMRGGLPPADKPYRDRTLTGYLAMTQPESKLVQIPIGTIPRMRCPLTVERKPGGYVASIGQPTHGDVDRRWVTSRVEVRDGRLVSVEKNWGQT